MATAIGGEAVNVDFFKEQMHRMVGLRFAPADYETHWEGLHELPDAALEAAVGRAIKTRVEFPTPIELRQDADQAAPRRVQPEPYTEPLSEPVLLGELPTGKPIYAQREWNYYCETCSDSGRREWWCGAHRRQPWIERKTCYSDNCKKFGSGYGHSWVEPCSCEEWNPTIKRRKEREAKYAERGAK